MSFLLLAYPQKLPAVELKELLIKADKPAGSGARKGLPCELNKNITRQSNKLLNCDEGRLSVEIYCH